MDERRIDDLIETAISDNDNTELTQRVIGESQNCEKNDQDKTSAQCQDCENEKVHICPLDEVEEMGIGNYIEN